MLRRLLAYRCRPRSTAGLSHWRTLQTLETRRLLAFNSRRARRDPARGDTSRRDLPRADADLMHNAILIYRYARRSASAEITRCYLASQARTFTARQLCPNRSHPLLRGRCIKRTCERNHNNAEGQEFNLLHGRTSFDYQHLSVRDKYTKLSPTTKDFRRPLRVTRGPVVGR